jgi:hypothetical protein
MIFMLLAFALSGNWQESTQWTTHGRVDPHTVYRYTCANGLGLASISRDWHFEPWNLDRPEFKRRPYDIYVMGELYGQSYSLSEAKQEVEKKLNGACEFYEKQK